MGQPKLHTRSLTAANVFFLASVFGMGMLAGPSWAAQADASFAVKVTLENGPNRGPDIPPGSGLCRNTTGADAFGSHATVVCSTGSLVDLSPGRAAALWTPIHGGAHRFVTQVFWNGDWLEGLDDMQGMGTITTWRIVNLANRNYLELTMGW